MAVRFETNRFEFSHGKKPRGGQSWAFEVEGSSEPVFAPSFMNFSEAKAWMKQKMKRDGFQDAVVHVAP